MDKSTGINHCTSSVPKVRDECQKVNRQPFYHLYTMRNVTKTTHWNNTMGRLTSSGCFSINQDEFHCPSCHTNTLCTEKLSQASNQTINELLQQEEPCIHRFHTRECVAYAKSSNASNLPAPRSYLSAGENAGANRDAKSQNQVTSRQNISGETTTCPNTSSPIFGAQVVVSSIPTLSELRTTISVNNSPWSIDRPVYPLCAVFGRRLRTFKHWPKSPSMSRMLAREGFLYTGESDKVCCAYCGIKLQTWGTDDDPFTEHARWRPDCAWLIQQKGKTFIDKVYKLQKEFNLGAPKEEYNTTDKASHPNFYSARNRSTTFNNDDLCSAKKSHDAADAGFLLITETDQLCCFFCNGKIKEWRKVEYFLSVHQHNYPNCHFIKNLHLPPDSVVADDLATHIRESVNLGSQ